MKFFLLPIMLLILASSALALGESGYSLDGEKGVWENAYAAYNISDFYIDSTEVINGVEYFVAYANFTWKAASNTIDLAFAFPEAVKGGIDLGSYVTLPNGTRITAWTDKTALLGHIQAQNKHFYPITDINAAKDELFMLRLRILPESISGEVKYDLYGKLTADSIATAISTGRYIALDPILYNFNVAAGVPTWATTNYSATYSSGELVNGVYAALTDCWIGADYVSNGHITLLLNESMNVGSINLTQGRQGYFAGQVIVQLSTDNNTWTQVDNYTFPACTAITQADCETNSHNFTNTNGYGVASFVRFNITNSSNIGANAPIGLCEAVISKFVGSYDLNFSTVNNNATVRTTTGHVVNWTVQLNYSGISALWFAHNDGGSFVNKTIIRNASIHSSPFVLTDNVSITAAIGTNVCGYFGANTTSGETVLSAESCFTVAEINVTNIINCSGQPGNVTLNVSFFDENNPNTLLVSGMEVGFVLWDENNNYVNRTYTLNGTSSYAFCIIPNSAAVEADVYFKGIVAFTHRYYMINANLTNTTSYISAYNFPETSGKSVLKVTVRDTATYQPLQNITASLLRNYVGEGVWRVVQMDRSDDYGSLIFHIIEQTQDYKVILYDQNGLMLKQTDSMKFVCTSSLCEITMVTQEFASTTSSAMPGVDITYSNITKIVGVSWSDSSGVTQLVRRIVSKETMAGTITICDNSTSSSTGSMNCNVTNYPGEVLIQVFVNGDPELAEWIHVGTPGLSAKIGDKEGAVWTGLAVIIAVGFGLWSPVAALISVTFILVAFAFLGIFSPLGATTVIAFALVSIVIGVVIKK